MRILQRLLDWWRHKKEYYKVKIFEKNRFKDEAVYNHANNLVMVRSHGNMIYVICHREEQIQQVVSRMTTDYCIFHEYEEWDEEEDKKWIVTFRILEDEEEELTYN